MSKYDRPIKKLKCRKCTEMVAVDQTTGSVTCWRCTAELCGGFTIPESERGTGPDCQESK
jgi:hypothetical protein